MEAERGLLVDERRRLDVQIVLAVVDEDIVNDESVKGKARRYRCCGCQDMARDYENCGAASLA